MLEKEKILADGIDIKPTDGWQLGSTMERNMKLYLVVVLILMKKFGMTLSMIVIDLLMLKDRLLIVGLKNIKKVR